MLTDFGKSQIMITFAKQKFNNAKMKKILIGAMTLMLTASVTAQAKTWTLQESGQTAAAVGQGGRQPVEGCPAALAQRIDEP